MAEAERHHEEEEKQSISPIIARIPNADEIAFKETMSRIEEYGLKDNILELELNGFTVLKGALDEDKVERAKAAILRRAEKSVGHPLDPETATAADFNGMNYQHYMIFDDPVFPEILLERKPLTIVQYLLGQSCVLSSMGSHFRGPGGLPLPLHADGVHVGMTEASLVANCNYALTPYNKENGALTIVPGSHRKNRQPTPNENWMHGDATVADVVGQQLPAEELDQLEWTPPPGITTFEIDPGDAVIWHGNTWHGGWRREAPGCRMNLAAYFCRPHLSTQERRGDDRYPEVFEKYADEPLFAQLMGEKVYNGWRDEGPDFTGAKTNPMGLFD